MDNFRPTIVVSELVTNRQDCASVYRMHTELVGNPDEIDTSQLENRAYYWNDRDEEEQQVEPEKRNRECITQRTFAQWEGG